MMSPPPSPLPGGIGLSGLTVYDWPAADGLCGGSPHMHLVCTEAYVVVAGTGSVQTLTAAGFAETPLAPGDVVWFTPGTIHRLVTGGDLRLVVLMQNGGLPEAGDAVFTFPSPVLADPEAYRAAATLGEDDPAAAARHRRDLALEGFQTLRRDGGLAAFHQAALLLKRDLFADWGERWRAGALSAAVDTGTRLARLTLGDLSDLGRADVLRLGRPERPVFGMCGVLDTYPAEAGGSVV